MPVPNAIRLAQVFVPVLFLLATGVGGAPLSSSGPRVLLIHGTSRYLEHALALRHQFDALRPLGWTLTAVEVGDLSNGVDRLEGHDLILVGREPGAAKSEFTRHHMALRRFLEQGGAMLVDAVRPGGDGDWVFGIEPGTAWEDAAFAPDHAQVDDSLLGFPNALVDALAESPPPCPLENRGWRILRTDASGNVSLAVRTVGKGTLVANRGVSDARLVENVWTSIQSRRILGGTVDRLDAGSMHPGSNTVWLTVGALPKSSALNYVLEVIHAGVPVAKASGSLDVGEAPGRHAIPVVVPDEGCEAIRLTLDHEGVEIVAATLQKAAPPVLLACLERDVFASGEPVNGLALVTATGVEGELNLSWRVIDAAGTERGNGRRAVSAGMPLASEPLPLALSSLNLAAGAYRWEVEAHDLSGRRRGRHLQPFDVAEAGRPAHVVALRDDGVLFVDGSPRLPLGFYRIPMAEIGALAGTPIDLAAELVGIPHKGIRPAADDAATRAALAEAGLDYLASVNWYLTGDRRNLPSERLGARWRRALPRLATDPRCLGVYLADEPPPAIMPEVSAAYREVKELVPNLPVVVTLHRAIEDFDAYSSAAPFCDILNVDNYPWPYRKPAEVAVAVDRARAIMRGRGSVWATLQTFRYSTDPGANPINEFPPEDWLRATAYLALTHGAKGLLCFSFNFLEDGSIPTSHPGQWQSILRVLGEVRALESALLSETCQPTGEIGKSGLHALASWQDGVATLMVVNAESRTAKATLRLPAGASVDVLFEDRTFRVGPDGAVGEDFAPLERHVYRLAMPEMPTALDPSSWIEVADERKSVRGGSDAD